MVDLSTIEVGNTVVLNDGSKQLIIAEQFIEANEFVDQDEPLIMLTCSGWATAIKYTLDGVNDDGYTSAFDIKEIHHTPQRCVVVNINDQPHAVYKNNYPSSEQILDCINAYGGFVPEIKMEDQVLESDGNFLIDNNHEQILAADFEHLIKQFLDDESITELNFEQNILTMDVFELETGNGKGATNER